MVLAVDLGQSGTRLRWMNAEYESHRAKTATESPLDVLRDVFKEVSDRQIGGLRNDVVAMSLTGVYGNVPDPSPFGKLAAEFFGATQVAVIDDGLAGFIGALGNEDGVALSVGSGVVGVAGRAKKFSHADGLGHIFGDNGGGFWLGQHGLKRALATRQGRESDMELLEFLAEEIAEFDLLPSNTGPGAQSLCIKAAKKVLEAAERNLPSALIIRDQGAHELARTSLAAWVGAGGQSDESLSLALLGGLSRNRGYAQVIEEEVSFQLPHVRVVSPRGNQLDGAAAIATSMKDDLLPLLRWWRKP